MPTRGNCTTCGCAGPAPEATLRAVADHGRIPADSIRGHYQDAAGVLSQLHDLGIDYDDITSTLEEQGLAAFDTSWRELGDQLAAAMRNTHKESGR